jgi:hypothetical protein
MPRAVNPREIDGTARPLLLWLRGSGIPLSLAEEVLASDPRLEGVGEPVGETRLLAPAQWEMLRAAIRRRKGTGGRKGARSARA